MGLLACLTPKVDGNIDRVEVNELLEPDGVDVLHSITYNAFASVFVRGRAACVPYERRFCICCRRGTVVAAPFLVDLVFWAEPLVQPQLWREGGAMAEDAGLRIIRGPKSINLGGLGLCDCGYTSLWGL